jgi:dTDP-glucose 4,6-dehydratase
MPRAVITGGAGFLGSHLCRRLLAEGFEVVCLDSLLTGQASNVEDLQGERFHLVKVDVTNYIHISGPVDAVLHFASPASPVDYLRYPIQTLKVGALGTHHALGLAKDKGARFLLASTSEVYGDPQVHPQPESYWGHVNPIGPRGVYDEAKRFAEAMSMAYHRTHGLPVRIARIFNTFGPYMRVDDGRAFCTFAVQALRGEALTVHGDGSQTRSLCYVDDLVEGLWRLLWSETPGPINIGNPEEITVLELARQIGRATGREPEIVFERRPVDDPEMRRPDITAAQQRLGWKPQVSLADGIRRTLPWFQRALDLDAGDGGSSDGGSPDSRSTDRLR